MADVQEAKKFLEKAVQYSKEGTEGHVSQQDYYDYMSQAGVTKELLNATVDAEEKLVQGMYLVATDKLKENIAKDMSNGGNGQDQGVTINVKIPKGNMKMHVDAARIFMASQAVGDKSAPRKPITKTCSTRLDIKRTSMLDKTTCRTVEEEVRKQLGI